MRSFPNSLALVVLGAIGCSGTRDKAPPPEPAPAQPAAPSLPPGEGRLPVPDGTIWYRVVGSGPATPVILLHGGPGFSSYYLKLSSAWKTIGPSFGTISSAAESRPG